MFFLWTKHRTFFKNDGYEATEPDVFCQVFLQIRKYLPVFLQIILFFSCVKENNLDSGGNCRRLRWDPLTLQVTEPPTAPRAPLCRLPTAPSVCALGWAKCREHISLLVILCIIVYVTNKVHLSLIIINIYIYIYIYIYMCVCVCVCVYMYTVCVTHSFF